MAIEAELADGRILEFPDGTDPAVIQSTVKRMIAGGSAPAPAATPTASEPTDTSTGMDTGASTSLGSFNSAFCIFKYNTFIRFYAHFFGCIQKYFRMRFWIFDFISADDCLKIVL